MEYEIRSLLEHEGTYVPIDLMSVIPNTMYMYGAIIWRIGANAILAESQADLVDQLWAYIIDGLIVLRGAGAFETYFPDQALLLRFDKANDAQCKITVGDREFTVDSSVMLASLCQGGRQFFARMCDLFPAHEKLWQEYLRKIDTLLSI